jgi:hypothetical protein
MWPLVTLAVFAGLQACYWLIFGSIRPDDLGGFVLTKVVGSMALDVLLVLGGTMAVISLTSAALSNEGAY